MTANLKKKKKEQKEQKKSIKKKKKILKKKKKKLKSNKYDLVPDYFQPNYNCNYIPCPKIIEYCSNTYFFGNIPYRFVLLSYFTV